jgi:hypothetical protein
VCGGTPSQSVLVGPVSTARGHRSSHYCQSPAGTGSGLVWSPFFLPPPPPQSIQLSVAITGRAAAAQQGTARMHIHALNQSINRSINTPTVHTQPNPRADGGGGGGEAADCGLFHDVVRALQDDGAQVRRHEQPLRAGGAYTLLVDAVVCVGMPLG